MAKLIMWNLISLDGYFEGTESWSIDWFTLVLGDDFHNFILEQLRTAETLVFGRVTYQGMAAHWKTATDDVAVLMNSLPKVVFSNTIKDADWNKTMLVHSDPVAHIQQLKQTTRGNIFVFGSGKLSRTLTAAGLFDEYRIGIVPILLGKGGTLFGAQADRVPLKLLGSQTFQSGFVVLRYSVVGAE
jgi:dihydrofolate reductase